MIAIPQIPWYIVIMWYVLITSPLGNYWQGPFSESTLRQAANAGEILGNDLLLDPNGRELTVHEAFGTHESGLASFVKFAIAGVGIYLGAKAISAIAQYLSDTPEQRSIRRSAREHRANGADVYADHIGWEEAPPLLGHRRPDVYADYGDLVVVEEHETKTSLNRQHSVKQDRDLRQWAKHYLYVEYKQIIS